MMRLRFRSLIPAPMRLLAPMLFLAIQANADDSARTFHVEIRVLVQTTVIATPRMIVAEGAEASVSRANGEPLEVALTIHSDGRDHANVSAAVQTEAGSLAEDRKLVLGEWTTIAQGVVGLDLRIKAAESPASAGLRGR